MLRPAFNCIFFLCFIISLNLAQDNLNYDYVPSELHVKFKAGTIVLPIEINKVYFSIPRTTHKIMIDSVNFLEFDPFSKKEIDRRKILREKIISYKELVEMNGNFQNKIKLNFNEDILGIFRKYSISSFHRGVKDFAPEDTLVRNFTRRDSTLITKKADDQNQIVILRFDQSNDARTVACELRKTDGIVWAYPLWIPKSFEAPNDDWYVIQDYLHPDVMNFEQGWNIQKMENPFLFFNIGFIDGDFTNVDILPDLEPNLNRLGPGNYIGLSSVRGHGTRVASVACAVTNNGWQLEESLIAGGTWNGKFIPFLGTNTAQILSSLEWIESHLGGSTIEDDVYVVNFSTGFPFHDGISEKITDLYDQSWVLFVGAAGNDGSQNVPFPANHDRVMSVGASNSLDDGLFSTSCWGEDIDVVATGESIVTVNIDDTSSYDYEYGTSCAAAFVTAALALIISTEQGWNTPLYWVKQCIILNGDLIEDQSHYPVYTYSRLNLHRALDDIVGIEDCIVIEGPTLLYEDNNYIFTGEFVDTHPYGNFIISAWDWILETLLYGSKDTLDTGQEFGSHETEWEAYLPDVDENKNWIFSTNGYAVASVKVTAMDDDQIIHTCNYPVQIDLPPQIPKNLTASLTPGPGYQYFLPRLNWTPNVEADIQDYLIFRKIANKGRVIESWHQIATTTNSSYTDETMPVLPEGTYDLYYKIRTRDDTDQLSGFSNQTVIYGVQIFPKKGIISSAVDIFPKELELCANFPNPFNPETNIQFGLPEDAQVELNIYSVSGQKVVTLVNGNLEKGYHTIVWSGQDKNSNLVASGVYIYELLADRQKLTNKMFLMK